MMNWHYVLLAAHPMIQILISIVLSIWLIMLWVNDRHSFWLWFALGLGVLPTLTMLSHVVVVPLLAGFLPNAAQTLPVFSVILSFGWRVLELLCLIPAILSLQSYVRSRPAVMM
ncbi:MAG: hypothetical protein RBU29_08030 [bacterium]|jgi:hypothetical protein|nr:hypothetical protein [bacterium]